MNTATLTVSRLNEAITVALKHHRKGWKVTEAVNEAGQPVELTMAEQLQAVSRAAAGEDETGK